MQNTQHTNTEFTLFHHSEVQLPREALEECCPPMMDATEVCEFWVSRIDWDQVGITDAEIREGLEETGAWGDRDLDDTHQNRLRFLWIASGDWRENRDL